MADQELKPDKKKENRHETEIRSRILVDRENEMDKMLGAMGEVKQDPEDQGIGLRRQFANPIAQGIVWAEILGRPLCKRRGRGRHGL